jgi:hypothetical protein
MSRDSALAAIALDAAVKVAIDAGSNTSTGVIAIASEFYTFLTGAAAAAAPAKVSVPTEEPAPPKAEKVTNIKGAPKAAAPKPAPAKVEPKPEPVKEVEPVAEEAEGPTDLDRVKATVRDLLAANLRQEATDLLKKHKAKSSSDLASFGTEAVDAFIAEAADLLMSA